MLKHSKSSSVSIRNNILKAISATDERIKVAEKNKAYKQELLDKVMSFTMELEQARAMTNHLSDMFKNTAYYIQEKKVEQLSILENAIQAVSSIVPSSEYTNCRLKHENGKTRILNNFDQPIIKREGDASISSMGILLVYCALKAQPDKIQMIFLDESASTLSSDSSINLKDVLQTISKDVGIIGIEQHNTLYNDISDKVYKVEKVDGFTTVKEVSK